MFSVICRRVTALVLALSLFLALPGASMSPPMDYMTDVYALPIDFTGGYEPLASGFISRTEYEDPTIHVRVESGRYQECDYWLARIKIASPTQLRTVSAGGFNTGMTMTGTSLAKRVNAVLAVDGDYYFYTGKGYILRQGVLYQNILDGSTDVLLIDEEGDFHVVRYAVQGSVTPEINGKKVINAMYFGPALVIDGEPVREATGHNMAQDMGRQRMCIAQVGPLEYMCICCAGPARGSNGMTLPTWVEFVSSFGVKTAYNLDGGDSTMLIFNFEKVNDVNNNSSRKISDIIYFASAWDE